MEIPEPTPAVPINVFKAVTGIVKEAVDRIEIPEPEPAVPVNESNEVQDAIDRMEELL